MDELSCKYVGSFGLLKSCQRRAPIPISDFDGLNPTLYDNIEEDNNILHVCPQAIPNFVNKVLPKLTRPFILLTNNSDWTIPDDISKEADILLNHPLMTHWFAQNCILDHSKITRIPIGLDYHTLRPTRKQQFAWSQPETHSWGKKEHPTDQEKFLIMRKQYSAPFWYREVKAYANFQFLMTTRYGKIDRVECLNTVSKDLVYYEPTKCIRDKCWSNMVKYAFVLSPQGNGLDCHRTWEALCLGCIPILKTSGLDPLFKDLPVWIVQDWKDVTLDNMKQVIEDYKSKTFNYEKLTLAYWQKAIYGQQNT
jgi:hypothetical protein